MAYRRAPYFADHADFLADYYARSYATITELCVPFIEYCMKELGLERTLWRSSELDLGAFDRTSVIPALCEKFSADTFVAGVHARDYLEWDRITSVRLEIFEYDHPAYPQLHPGFQSHLSVLDLLMNCGPESRTLVKGTT
ncbi:WbqC family protein [Streptomyces lasalocidi]